MISLHTSVKQKRPDIALISSILEKGANVNELDNNGFTPLHYAAIQGKPRVTQLLLEHGADISLRSSNHQIPLHYAARSCAFNKCEDEIYQSYKLLLEKGANCNDVDDEQSTPFHSALKCASLKIIKLMLKYGADITLANNKGLTAIHFAARNRSWDVIGFVLDQGFDMECSTYDGFSPLHTAAIYANERGCEFFLKRGAMINRNNNLGVTPLAAAILSVQIDQEAQLEVFCSQQRIVEMLLDYGAAVACHSRGMSIMKVATAADASQVLVSILIRQIAQVQYVNSTINEEDREMIEGRDSYKRYHSKCLQELEIMDETKFYNNVSLLSIFVESEKVSRYARNEKLVEALEKKDYENKFPIYYAWLKKRFVEEVRAQKLLAKETKAPCNSPLRLVQQAMPAYLQDEMLSGIDICSFALGLLVSGMFLYFFR